MLLLSVFFQVPRNANFCFKSNSALLEKTLLLFQEKNDNMKTRFGVFFHVENVYIYLAVADIDICGVWHLAPGLRFVVILDGKFICGLFASKHKSSFTGLEKMGKQLKLRMPRKSKSLEGNILFRSCLCSRRRFSIVFV